jgi:hypothetical protein
MAHWRRARGSVGWNARVLSCLHSCSTTIRVLMPYTRHLLSFAGRSSDRFDDLLRQDLFFVLKVVQVGGKKKFDIFKRIFFDKTKNSLNFQNDTAPPKLEIDC